MKKIIYICAFLLVGGLFSSCANFLEETSPDKLSSDTFWRNKEDAEKGISAVYSQLEYAIDTYGFAEVKWPVEAYREDIVSLGRDAMNYPNWVELANFTFTNGNSQVYAYWWNNYRGISYANQVIEKVPGIPEGMIEEDERKNLINEARFLRGYYYLKLQLNWEKIVIRDKYITSQADMNKGLSPRTASWDFLIADFEAATALPAAYDLDNTGRATSGAAYAYLAYAYLTRAYEEEDKKTEYLEKAVQAFDKVVGYELVSDFQSMFKGLKTNTSESIFELQFTMNDANGAFYQTCMHKWIGCSEVGGWDEILPSEMLMREFKKEGKIAQGNLYDKRLYHTIYFKDDYFNGGPGTLFGENTYDEVFGANNTKAAFHKYLPSTWDGMNYWSCAINIPLMRYANVLLMKAEALNELGRTAEAIPLINQVREVHGDMPPMQGSSQADVRAQIEHERMLEFPLENLRWYDLRRWGKLEEAMQKANRKNFVLDKHAFYPIPLKEINANDALKKGSVTQ